jgi:fructose-1,6-bisphosphatase/inositol monophosphatase family enzyme
VDRGGARGRISWRGTCSPWDRLPGALLITEAGGAAEVWDVGGISWFVAGHREQAADRVRQRVPRREWPGHDQRHRGGHLGLRR